MGLIYLVFITQAILHYLLLGGVFGLRPFDVPPDLLSDAFNIEKLHMRVSSTDINAPELSNSPQ